MLYLRHPHLNPVQQNNIENHLLSLAMSLERPLPVLQFLFMSLFLLRDQSFQNTFPLWTDPSNNTHHTFFYKFSFCKMFHLLRNQVTNNVTSFSVLFCFFVLFFENSFLYIKISFQPFNFFFLVFFHWFYILAFLFQFMVAFQIVLFIHTN